MKLQLNNITKKYGSVTALSDFSFQTEDKRFVAVVGPSGCGKTTLLRIIAGLTKPTSGSITVDGKDITQLPCAKRNVAMVFQNYALSPYQTVFENIAFPLKMKKVGKNEIREKVASVAGTLGITDKLDCYPDELSGGQKQRTAIGRAMVSDPKIFLLDEPLSNLDAVLKADMRALITDLYKKSDATFLYVTHDQTEAMSMATDIIVLKDGSIEQSGAPEHVYRRPINKFVAGFIGSPQMSFLDGSFIGEKGCVGLRSEDVTEGGSIKTTVKSVELLGGDAIAYLQTEGGVLKMRTKKVFVRGETVFVSINRDNVYRFDDDGNAVYY